jgi:hypothetical protein
VYFQAFIFIGAQIRSVGSREDPALSVINLARISAIRNQIH